MLGDVYALERDEGVRTLLRRGWTLGCFYIESPAMRSLFDKLHCETFEMVVAASSVIRPGVAESGMMQEFVARATGRRAVTYPHPAMERLLGGTFGVMVYQEDVLRVAHELGGLTLGEADLLRRAMSGKGRSREAMARLETKFFDSCRRRGFSEALAGELWRQIASFAQYAFCKGHSAAFAVLSFQMTWLKAHYPAEFLAGVLANRGGFYSTAAYVSEARRLGIVVSGPCVNASRLDWWGRTARRPGEAPWWRRRDAGDDHGRRGTTAKGEDEAVQAKGGEETRKAKAADAGPTGWIRAGLLAIAGLSPGLLERLLHRREHEGPFASLRDLLERTHPQPEEARRLILSGACDVFGRPRASLMIEQAVWERTAAGAAGYGAGHTGVKDSAVSGPPPDLFSAPGHWNTPGL